MESAARGVGGALYGVTVGTALNVTDMGQAGASLAWNELGGRTAYNWLTNSNAPEWYADLHSPTAQAYRNGTSRFELIASNVPVANIGVASYHATTSLMKGDWNGLAEQAGGIAGGVVIGAGIQRYSGMGASRIGKVEVDPRQVIGDGDLPNVYDLQRPPVSATNNATRKYGPKPGETEPNWGSMVREFEGEPPADMVNPHGHHSIFKQGRGQKMQQYLNESKDIAELYDIDWYKGRESLGWAPNKNHSTAAAKTVRDALMEAHTTYGTRGAVVDALARMKDHFRNDTIHTLFDK